MRAREKERRYYSIGEVAKLLRLEPHVLRFWEREFRRQIRPIRIGGRRLYSTEQVETFRKIKHLLYEEGYTIAGAKRRLFSQDQSLLLLRQIRRELLKIYELLK